MTANVEQTAAALATDARRNPDRRERPRRSSDLTGYARALAEGLAYAHEQTA